MTVSAAPSLEEEASDRTPEDRARSSLAAPGPKSSTGTAEPSGPTTSPTTDPGPNPAYGRHWRGDVSLVALYARREPKLFTLAVGGATLFALLTVGWSRTLGGVVDKIIRPLLTPETAATRPSALQFARDNKTSLLLLLGAVGWLRLMAALVRRVNAARLAHASSHTWRSIVVRHLVDQPLSFFRRSPTGTLLANADNDPDAATAVLHPLPYALGVIALIGIALAWLISVDPLMALVSAIVLPATLALNEQFQKRAERPNEAVQEDVAKLGGVVHETVDGIAAVKALGLERHMSDLARPKIAQLREHKLQLVRLRSIVNTLETLIPQLVNVGLVVLGAWRVRAGVMSIGDVVAIVSLYNLLVWPLQLLAWAMFDMSRSRAGLTRLESLLAVEPPNEQPPGQPASADDVIDLHDVSLVHDDGRRALDHVSLRIRRGFVTAIVGATGSGKSTLLHVLAGLDPPTSGHRGSATASIAMVFQEPLVLSGTIAHNLALGATIDPRDERRALSVSGSDEFVDALADGTKTRLGERGVSLSGGQRQRLALARALARRTDVLLLDDTTSALDATTEAHILSSLRTNRLVETMVLVASRPSTITYADFVIVIDGGRIVAEGTHDELRVVSPDYRRLLEALQHA